MRPKKYVKKKTMLVLFFKKAFDILPISRTPDNSRGLIPKMGSFLSGQNFVPTLVVNNSGYSTSKGPFFVRMKHLPTKGSSATARDPADVHCYFRFARLDTDAPTHYSHS